MQILGALTRPDCTQSYHLFSPNVQAFIIISQFESGSQISCLTLNQLRSAMLATFAPVFADSLSATVSTLVDKMDTNPSVLLLFPHACRISESISFIKKFRSIYELDGLECLPCDSNTMKTLGFCFSKCDSYKGFRASPHMFRVACKLSELWERSRTFRDDDTLQATHNNRSSSLLIAGPKGAEQSSLLRFIINYFMTAAQLEPSTPTLDRCIAVLDCVVGQPEFTPNGMISLTLVRRPPFGLHFTHLTLLDPASMCQCFVGCISPSGNPKFHLQCLVHIYGAHKDLQEPRPPLLVNTVGWTQGLGFALLVEQILLTKPHVVVQIHLKAEQPGVRQNLSMLDQTTLRTAQGWNFKDLPQEVFRHKLVIIPSMSFLGTRDRVQYEAPIILI
ncbi:unnamed protein product [Dicrocoelium dendriticum]|nr:unnamed protein product [Dicrocoelium dendriticum]